MATIDEVPLMARLEKVPDGVVVLVCQGVVRMVPVHEVAEALRLFDLKIGKREHALSTLAHKVLYAVALDVALRVEPERSLHRDLDPEPLTIEPVLVALLFAQHRV